MMYDTNLLTTMLDVLENRMSSIADCITVLVDKGYIPSKNKTTIFYWTGILIDAYENINVFTKEQQIKLDNIYNKVLKL